MDKRLLQLKGIRGLLALLGIVSLIQGASIIFQAQWLAHAITTLFDGKSLSQATPYVLLFLAAFLVRHGLTLIREKVMFTYSSRIGADVRKQLLDQLFRLGPAFTKKKGTGKLVTLAMEGIAQYRQYLQLFLPKMVNMAVIPVMVLIYVWTLDDTSAVILIVTLPILIIFMILLGLVAQRKAAKQWRSYEKLSNHFTDSLRGLETLRYLGISKKHSRNIGEVSKRYRKATMSTLKVAFLSSFALDFFSMLSIATVAVFLGLRLIEGELLLLPALTALMLAPEYFLPVREVGNDYHATLNGKEANEAMQVILEEKGFRTQETQSVQLNEWNEQSALTLHDVSVQHDEHAPYSIQDVDLTVKGKKKIGIIGASGSGKSTLTDVLGGFVEPTSGQITLNGNPLVHLQMKEWQKEVVYMPQHPYLFHMTLRENIRFYEPNATDEEVEIAASEAGLSQLVAQLPNGFDEVIGEQGRGLSGGQAQRIALARTVLGKRSIMLLDEPTAHLDIETEYELKKTMLPLFEDKLVFLATHRLHWMPDMNEIIVMDEGTIAEMGTHESLMQRKGVYYQLVQEQMGAVTHGK
ncbi:thiol reductant ABC exporter subunit CydD [Bacillus pumilus]|uniref:ATP-binding protein n=1 Tax=Bacillus pumilus (strain SAFR-032) TaxID=315750 RepID=A8FIU8_BACP2|nr:thiol reductant ABC exporter subunit CydD [Bacillus pumilus]ABV64165.1 ATP-binding protein [Bacillus pumilus SAFR-032]MBC3641082.1 thiol reductant ABC exporter subunit CydD [Bacillus pumilus]MBC3647275.1 thiol reductant ABC exporter subunit CydD [Bacillus pumilus]MBC3648596.1 thiol reductant ABC exporter subunit CydD [Bacillus pumilus]MBC3652556.1 thiol reductant ABC exporter subunit CydD [Bacillus pumilus]